MEQIDQRLRETSEHCFKCYETWNANQKDNAARGALQDAIHELRKVTSRLEIELAVSERNEMAQRPIPIPPHRDAQRRVQGGESNEQDFGQDDFGNQDHGNNHQSSGPRHHQGGQHRRRPPRKMGGGGGNYGGGNPQE